MSGLRTLRRRLWQGWLALAARFGEVQTLVVLGFVYAFVFGPVAVVTQLAGRDFLDKHRLGQPDSAWRDSDARPPELDNLKQPF